MSDVHGFCDERFAMFDDVFRANLDEGLDKGASLAVTLRGEYVVDLWGGTSDYAEAKPWEADTLVRVFSSSKVVVIIAVLMLADRGLLDLDAPIAQYWPEFAKNGKESITATQVLTHRSGVPGFGRSISVVELSDWDLVVGLLEDATPWYEPGSISCYHSMTFGHLLGELVRRVSDLPFDEFVHRELTGPLGADFHFGLTTPPDRERVAALWPPARNMTLPTEMGQRVMDEVFGLGAWVDPELMSAVIPAASGMTNARAMARIGGMLASGGAHGGRRYLSRAMVERATTEHSYMEDEVVGWCRYGLGFGLHSAEFPSPTPTTFHWGGYGGSLLTMDLESGLSCAFDPNQLDVGERPGDDRRFERIWQAVADASSGSS